MKEEGGSFSRGGVILYLGLCLFRLANAWLIQTQFDPDEYWQTLEPAYCEAFAKDDGYPCAYTWEWTRRASSDDDTDWLSNISRSLHGPIRSYVSVLPTYLWYRLVRVLQLDVLLGSWTVSKGPMLVHAVLVAAPTDLCIWWMARHVALTDSTAKTRRSSKTSSMAWWALFCSLTSWFQGYAMIRTYSNSIEAMLLAVGMALVAPEFFGSTASPRFALRSCLAFWLGGLSVAVRFTAVAAWVPLGFLLAFQHSTSWIDRIRFLFWRCKVSGILGVTTATAVDRWFYGFWTVPFLGSLHFNVLLGHGSLYGTHPFHWYLSSGIPAITGLLLPLLLYDAYQCFLKGPLTAGQQNTWAIILFYTLLHSFSAHKEFRFLLPILPLFCIRAGSVLAALTSSTGSQQRQRKSYLLILLLFAIPNLIAVLYLGIWHQRAPLDIPRQIRQHVMKNTDLPSASAAPTAYSIHFLLGCHATPLYSHLHVPAIYFDAWTLDCSPSCRSKQSTGEQVVCESERFHQDPVGFVQANYRVFRQDGADDEQTCDASLQQECQATTAARPTPDFLVVMAAEAAQLKEHLATMHLEEVGRSFHGINGIRIGTMRLGDDFDDTETFRHVKPLNNDWIELSLDEMILFARTQPNE